MVVLAGPSGSGKSTWAAARFRAAEIVSSDALRAVVGTGPGDLEASVEAFALLDQILAARLRRGLTTVVDTLGLDRDRRTRYLQAARSAGLPAVLVLFDTEPALCRLRNRERDRPVPAPALTHQLRRFRSLLGSGPDEGWELVLVERQRGQPAEPEPPVPVPATPLAIRDQSGPRVMLQLSRFPWGGNPTAWLGDIARA